MKKEDWKKWIEQQKEKVRQEYINTPQRLIQDYIQEISLNKQYNGRQLLELIQNADDESEKANDKKVLIKISENKLIVANNGTQFSSEGIESFRFHHISPKRQRKNIIGHKGLGFRSILNWAKQIEIISGDLSVKFSEEISERFRQKLLENNYSLKDIVNENRVATLSVPEWIDNFPLTDRNYDTYIILELKESILEKIKEQIEDLNPETLIFLHNLEQIEIDTPWKKETIIADRKRKENKVKISIFNDKKELTFSKEWELRLEEGIIPESLIQNLEEQKEYNIKIAFNKNLDDSINRLFCYFITKEKFPFPILIHATLNLDESRNHIVEDDINKYILNQLSKLLVEISIDLNRDKINWDRLKFLAKRGDFSLNVEAMGFYDSLINIIKDKELIPTKCGYKVSSSTYYYNYKEFNEILSNYNEFSNLAFFTDDNSIKGLLEKLGKNRYTKDELVSKLNNVSVSLTLLERAKIIKSICDNHYDLLGGDYKGRPALFMDNHNKFIKSNFDLVLPPEGSFDISFPNWVTQRFIDLELVKLLQIEFKANSLRDLRNKLSIFNVQEYSFSSFIRSIITSARERLKIEENSNDIIKQLVDILISIYKNKNIEQFPENVQVPLLNNELKVKNAKELYFGQEYKFGEINYNLLKNVDSSIFLADKDTLGLDIDEEEIKDFFTWLGVALYPRLTLRDLNENEPIYKNYILEKLAYPLILNHEAFNEPKDLKIRGYKIKIQDVEFIDKILEKADFEYILAWLIKDAIINNIIRDRREINSDSCVSLLLKSKQDYSNIYGQKIPAYLTWLLETKVWIPISNGDKEIPSNCCMNANLAPLIENPKLNLNHYIFKKNLMDIKEIELLLSKIGVVNELKELNWNKIYSILLDLPNSDPEGKKANNFYTLIIKDRDIEKLDEKDSGYINFMKNGMLLGEEDNIRKYYPIKKLFYLENINFPKTIRKRKPILCITRKIGAKRVESILGVKQLTEDTLNIKVKSYLPHKLNQEFDTEFEIFKPYIYFYRIEKDSKRENYRSLKNLKVMLCSSLDVESDTQDLILDTYETVREKNIVYILVNKEINKMSDLLEEDDFCDTVSETILNTFKIVDNEIEMKIKMLLSKRDKRKKRFLKDEGEDAISKLEECKSLLGLILTSKISFWENLFDVKGKILSENIKTDDELLQIIKDNIYPISEDTYNGIDYDNYSNPDNYGVFDELFGLLKITLQDFNVKSYKKIDFSEYLKVELRKVFALNEKKFRVTLFNKLQLDLEKQRHFKQFIDDYDNFEFEIPSGIFTDINEYFYILVMNKFGISKEDVDNAESVELGKIYSKNREKIIKELKEKKFDENEIGTFLGYLTTEDDSLVYFGKDEKLIDEFVKTHTPKESPQKPVKTQEEVLKEQLKILEQEIIEHPPDIEEVNIKKPEERTPKTPRHKKNNEWARLSEKEKEDIGLKGEKVLYETLKIKYGIDNVQWVSLNAKKAGINPLGNDASGCDIYLNRDGKIKYIEVKSSKNEVTSFNMSKDEIKFGEGKKDDYEVWLVLNCMDKDTRKIKNLGTVFKYESKDESFNNNLKFSVENDNFIISFTLDEE